MAKVRFSLLTHQKRDTKSFPYTFGLKSFVVIIINKGPIILLSLIAHHIHISHRGGVLHEGDGFFGGPILGYYLPTEIKLSPIRVQEKTVVMNS